MITIYFRMWSGTKMFYDTKNVAECLKQQMYHNAGEQLGYDHVGLHNSIFMQYTGLNDSFGVRVYDGDIFQNSVKNTWQVYWDSKEYSFAVLPIKSKGKDEKHLLGKYKKMLEKANVKFEVIGNIFENPELLK